MLTTCPNCLHVFHNIVVHPQEAPCCVSVHLPPSSTCTVSVSTSRMAGGGIVLANPPPSSGSVILQQRESEKLVVPNPCSPQPSPSTPLSFVLPSRTSMPWLSGPAASVPQAPQPDADLERLAATMAALRASGWYYEGLSWQESAEALQSTSPGTFLVRDSSDPRFLFSLSVQTEKGPTSVRLHYVGGQFRLDAEPRLAPLMPLFDCVVQLVEYYIDATRDTNKEFRHKEQVWVDARGHMYSHILLTTPLYKKNRLPSLQHLARLAINRALKASGSSSNTAVSRLPLPAVLTDYLKEYPHTH